MRQTKLDKIDKKILRDLQENGRITNVELADRAGISAPPCLRRVRTLEKNGFIKSYHAKLNPSSLGYTVTVFAMVKLSSQAQEDLKAFEKAVTSIPQVRECHLLAGEVDYVLKIVAENWDKYQDLHTNNLTNAPHVVSVKSSLAIRCGKDEPGVPVNVD